MNNNKYKNTPIKSFVNNSFATTQKHEAKTQKYNGKNYRNTTRGFTYC